MAADILILNIHEAQGGFVNVRVIFWITVANPFPTPNAVSAYPAITTDPNTSGLLAKIQDGTLLEEVHGFLFPTLWVGGALWGTAVESLLLAYLKARQSIRAGGNPAIIPDPGLKYKILHDTVTGWSA